jgi:hypothetical protein
MRLLRFAAIAALLAGVLQASVTAPPKPPPPGWPTEPYATFVARLSEVDLVVFEFDRGAKLFVTERAWLDAFKTGLATDQAKPEAYCFCVSEPLMKLYAKDKLLCSFQLTHDQKVRFGANDFVVPAKTYDTLLELCRIALKNERYAPAKKSPGHAAPPRVELKP